MLRLPSGTPFLTSQFGKHGIASHFCSNNIDAERRKFEHRIAILETEVEQNERVRRRFVLNQRVHY